MIELPAPPLPPDCDLRGLEWMPLDVVRLRDSELVAVPNAEAFRVAVLSWCVSWHQVPAASLPDDDATLARLLGFGRDLRGWKRVREAGGLRGWVKHNDGRLYHPVVASKALEAKAQQERSKTKRQRDAERLRKWRIDHGETPDDTRTETHSETRFVAEIPDRTLPNLTVPDHTRPESASSPSPAAPASNPAAATALKHVISGFDPRRVLRAIQGYNLIRLVDAFGANVTRGNEWERDANGQNLAVVATVFDWRMNYEKKPIREPSGLRQALEEWAAQPLTWRREYAQQFAAAIGMPIPKHSDTRGGQ